MDKIKSNTNFYIEINKYNIHVPYYQRDYAQGRTDGGRIDNIRRVFVEELFKATNGKEICHLGLVFGSYDEHNKVFIAVDGQQRLTTVFLLYWYVAWRENKLSNYKNMLEKFSWSTRNYSSQFTDLLFRIAPNDNVNVIDTIKSHCDYFPIWENDPTVKGMLTMLEEIETQYPKCESDLCENLFQNGCNIKYDILKLEKDSDGKTYLKMNSRGRSLTTFELFKSKFIDKYHPDFGSKFDNEWLNFMLERTKNEGQFAEPDFSFMNLINEYAYLQLRLNEDEKSENADNYKEFINAKITENLIDTPFISFEKYQNAFENKLGTFEKFFNWIIANYDKIKFVDDNIRFNDSRFFIDAIIRDNNPNFSHRVKLFALFKFAELSEYNRLDEKLYKSWSRVFRNLVANTDIEASYFSKICKTINKINSCNIYLYLSKGGELSSFDGGQIKEEVVKAKQILDENGELRKYTGKHSNYQTWEEIINEAENSAFFKGAIRFLFQSENGKADINISTGIWNTENFDTKFNNSKKYFDENGIKDIYKVEVVKSLVFLCDDWENQLYDKQIFDPQNSTWKWILTDKNWTAPIHNILTKDLNEINCSSTLNNPDANKYILPILKNLPYKEFIIEEPRGRFRWNGQLGYYKPNGRDAITFDWGNFRRNELLTQLKLTRMIKISNKEIGSFWWGWNIGFIYKNLYFKFYWNNTICLMNDNWNGKKLRVESEQDKPENNFYYQVSEKETSQSLLEQLDNLIQAFNNKSNNQTNVNPTN